MTCWIVLAPQRTSALRVWYLHPLTSSSLSFTTPIQGQCVPDRFQWRFLKPATSLYTQPLRVTLALHVLPLLLARALSKLSDSAKHLLWSNYQQLTFTSQPTTKLIGSSHLNSLPKIPHCRQRTPLSGTVSVPMCPFFLTEWRSIFDQVGRYPTSLPKTTWALA